MTQQEKWVVLGLLAALLLGATVRSCRRGAHHSALPSLKDAPLSP